MCSVGPKAVMPVFDYGMLAGGFQRWHDASQQARTEANNEASREAAVAVLGHYQLQKRNLAVAIKTFAEDKEQLWLAYHQSLAKFSDKMLEYASSMDDYDEAKIAYSKARKPGDPSYASTHKRPKLPVKPLMPKEPTLEYGNIHPSHKYIFPVGCNISCVHNLVELAELQSGAQKAIHISESGKGGDYRKYICKDPCPFVLTVSLHNASQQWRITNYVAHTNCSNQKVGTSAEVLAADFIASGAVTATSKRRQSCTDMNALLRNSQHVQKGYQISRAVAKASQILAPPFDTFGYLQSHFAEMKLRNPGSKTIIIRDKDGNFVGLAMCLIQQLLMARHCMNVSSVDAGHLRSPLWGKHKIMAMGSYDGENKLCPLVFAIVPSESIAYYDEMINLLLSDEEVHTKMSEEQHIFITDRGPAVLASINNIKMKRLPTCLPRYCARHLMCNLKQYIMSDELQRGYWRLVHSETRATFEEHWEMIRAMENSNPMLKYLDKIPRELWTTYAFKGIYKSGLVTNNQSEQLMSIFTERVRNMGPIDIVKWFEGKLMDWVSERKILGDALGTSNQILTNFMNDRFKKELTFASDYVVPNWKNATNNIYFVQRPTGNSEAPRQVNLVDRTCSCRRDFESPCRHIMKVLALEKGKDTMMTQPELWFHPCFLAKNYIAAYNTPVYLDCREDPTSDTTKFITAINPLQTARRFDATHEKVSWYYAVVYESADMPSYSCNNLVINLLYSNVLSICMQVFNNTRGTKKGGNARMCGQCGMQHDQRKCQMSRQLSLQEIIDFQARVEAFKTSKNCVDLKTCTIDYIGDVPSNGHSAFQIKGMEQSSSSSSSSSTTLLALHSQHSIDGSSLDSSEQAIDTATCRTIQSSSSHDGIQSVSETDFDDWQSMLDVSLFDAVEQIAAPNSAAMLPTLGTSLSEDANAVAPTHSAAGQAMQCDSSDDDMI